MLIRSLHTFCYWHSRIDGPTNEFLVTAMSWGTGALSSLVQNSILIRANVSFRVTQNNKKNCIRVKLSVPRRWLPAQRMRGLGGKGVCDIIKIRPKVLKLFKADGRTDWRTEGNPISPFRNFVATWDKNIEPIHMQSWRLLEFQSLDVRLCWSLMQFILAGDYLVKFNHL